MNRGRSSRGAGSGQRAGEGSVTGLRFFLGGGLLEKTFFRLLLSFSQAEGGALVLPDERLCARNWNVTVAGVSLSIVTVSVFFGKSG